MLCNLSLSYAALVVGFFYVIELVYIFPFMFLGLGSYFKRSSPLQHCKNGRLIHNPKTRCRKPTAAHLQCCRNQQRIRAPPEMWCRKPKYCSSPALRLTADVNRQLHETENCPEYGPLGVSEEGFSQVS